MSTQMLHLGQLSKCIGMVFALFCDDEKHYSKVSSLHHYTYLFRNVNNNELFLNRDVLLALEVEWEPHRTICSLYRKNVSMFYQIICLKCIAEKVI